jgi:hypothetical protein
VDSLDPPIMAAEAEQVERARRGLVTGPIRVSMPYRADRTNALAAATITSLCALQAPWPPRLPELLERLGEAGSPVSPIDLGYGIEAGGPAHVLARSRGQRDPTHVRPQERVVNVG